MHSEDYNSGFQIFLLAPSKDELKEPAKEGTKTNFQIYTEEEVVEAPKEVVKVPQREPSVPGARFLTRIDSREVQQPAQEEVKVAPREYSRDFQQPEARDSPRVSIQKVEEPVKEDGKA
jgi:hypothetical protein